MLITACLGLQQQSVALQNTCSISKKRYEELESSFSTTLGKLKLSSFGATNIEGNDEMTCQYTDFPVYSVFITLFDLLKPFVFDSSLKPEAAAKAESTAKDQFYATLIKLRHNVPMADLA